MATLQVKKWVDLAKHTKSCHGTGCQDTIEKGCAQVGISKEGVRSPYYYHVPCFLSSAYSGNVTDLDRFDFLPWSIQVTLRNHTAATATAGVLSKDIRATLVRDDDFIGTSENQTECAKTNCLKYILPDHVFIQHYEVCPSGHIFTNCYHLRCWLGDPAKPPHKPFSEYQGWDQIPVSLHDEVLGVCPESPTDIRVDSSSPARMTKPTLRMLPRRCLATNLDGRLCRWTSASSHSIAAPLSWETKRYTCLRHERVVISPKEIKRYERNRKLDFGVKLFQYVQNEEKKERMRKRARRG